MPLWSGRISLPPSCMLSSSPTTSISISISAAHHTHTHVPSTLLPRHSKLSVLGFIDPTKIPLWMAAGPSLNVYTGD
ncbi:hypothetical protein BDZ91DRAFT_730741, partial [Kalaharituber pfeilii]